MARCPICQAEYTKLAMRDTTCGEYVCRTELRRQKERKKAERAQRKKDKARLQELKPVGQLMAEVQPLFNKMRRMQCGDMGCISCGNENADEYHGGHFIGVGRNASLRFEPKNVWKQCNRCNTYLRGNLLEYRKRLVLLIGLETVEWLEGPHPIKNYTRQDIIDLAAYCRAEIKRLQAKRRGFLNAQAA